MGWLRKVFPPAPRSCASPARERGVRAGPQKRGGGGGGFGGVLVFWVEPGLGVVEILSGVIVVRGEGA